jgi:ribosomal protein S18 acetylase RimI-like enzyme
LIKPSNRMQPSIIIKEVTLNEAPILLEISRITFFTAFAPINKAEDMDAYASKSFTLSKIEEELNCPDSYFYFAMLDGEIAGYLKINYHSAQTDVKDPNALEVERIYVLQPFQGRQIGNQLLNFAIETGRQKSMQYVWLGVWEHNYKAIKFYQSNGFEVFASHPFVLGTDHQTDLLLKKEL